MNNETPNPYRSMADTPLAAPKPKKRRRWVTPALLAAGVAVGAALGAAGEPAAPEPEVREVTVTEEVEVPTTPQICLEALDRAETVIQYAAEGIGIMADGFDAASRYDVSGIEAATAELDTLQGPLQVARAEYDSASMECRG